MCDNFLSFFTNKAASIRAHFNPPSHDPCILKLKSRQLRVKYLLLEELELRTSIPSDPYTWFLPVCVLCVRM